MSEFSHKPIMLMQCIEGLAIRPDGIYVDGTCGGAGHSKEIAKRIENGMLYGLDQDPDAVAVATERLQGLPAKVLHTNFRAARTALAKEGVEKIDGVLLDLGVSSYQLDNAERGFSYHADAYLDMRMSKEGPSAADLVNTLSLQEITDILREYGEEKFAYQIAKKIVAYRENQPITTTMQLSEIVNSAYPAAERRKSKNPSRKTFQALRIAVNDELGALKDALEDLFEMLNPGGRMCIITFHSLEDRIVKQYFKQLAVKCTCPKEFPVCVCGGKAKAKLITNKPLVADREEQEENRRSRSAKLRIVEKLEY
ncbi:MAG: 16S rRNA (cytosine(1402)-N(4))-methyltransferase RsmH [Oscillospiraceae bacterium]|nr:16S rRNA (cytosine(1402)-N(4))-methyltransferase RsmH [Oscillospiraceae bacterium]